jgi:CrcB protein
MPELALILAIAVAGGIGSVIRSFITPWTGFMPWGVLITNSLAAIAIGLLLGGPDFLPENGQIVMVGFAGGLSTFSGVARASFGYWFKGRILQSAATLILNVLIPLGALWMTLNLG